MLNFILSTIIFLVIFFTIDIIWLGAIAKKFYRKKLSHLMDIKFKPIPAILFYIIYPALVTFFVIHPSLQNSDILYSIYAGLLIGLLAYSTYDLTNHSTLLRWPTSLTIVDIVWGSILTSISSFATYSIMFFIII